jgi:hypothetical protein
MVLVNPYTSSLNSSWNLINSCASRVQSPAPKPYIVSFAIAIASSVVLKYGWSENFFLKYAFYYSLKVVVECNIRPKSPPSFFTSPP